MIKTITLRSAEGEEKWVPMKSDAALPRLYKMYFGEDFFLKIKGTGGLESVEGITQLNQEKAALIEKSSRLIDQKEAISKEIETLESVKPTKASAKVIGEKRETLEKMQKEFDDLISTLEGLEKEINTLTMTSNVLEVASEKTELIENMAYIFAKQADKNMTEDIVEWLSQFDATSIMDKADEIMAMYQSSAQTVSIPKKK